MKNSIKTKILALTCAILTIFAAGCSNSSDSSSTDSTSSQTTAAEASSEESSAAQSSENTAETSSAADTSTSSNAETSEEESDNIWANAQYKEDTELGKGQKTVLIEVAAADKKITVTLHTDKETLGDALTENKLVEGNKTEYGLYITAVNGMTADYDKDKAYWAISKNGEYSNTGADSTKIADGEHYELTYTKG